jgi:hypothetical protein
MANTEKPDREFLQLVGQELGDFFLLSEKERVGVAESFQVWVVGYDDFSKSLLSRAVWHGVWHHQIGPSPGKARAYARSIVGLEKQVRAVCRSPLAAELDGVIDEIDRTSEFDDDALVVRLCTIPELDFIAAWITNAENSMVPLGRHARHGDRHFKPLPAEAVRKRLRNKRRIVGLAGELKC